LAARLGDSVADLPPAAGEFGRTALCFTCNLHRVDKQRVAAVEQTHEGKRAGPRGNRTKLADDGVLLLLACQLWRGNLNATLIREVLRCLAGLRRVHGLTGPCTFAVDIEQAPARGG
jgi:hypothetical protein